MIRKMLLVAAAIAMPLGITAVTAVNGATSAGATPTTCSVSATITFAPPGISNPGSISMSKTTQTTVTGETFGGGCTGSGPNLAINSKSVKCDKHTAGLPSSNTACTPGNYGYGSWSNYASSGASTIQKATKKLSFTVNGVTYKTKTTSATAVGCAGGEAGFKVVGTISSPKAQKGQPSTFTACLGAVTGTGLTSYTNFVANFNGPGTVATAQIDPATSTLVLGS
jgi:hypothetical protein